MKFQTNKVGGRQASVDNLFAAVDEIIAKKPRAVTIVYSDHGGPDELAAWNEGLSYRSVQEIDHRFSGDVVVRRIHTHCYSGAALQPAGFKAESSDETAFLKAYPQNRCGVSAALAGEFGYEFTAKRLRTLGKSPSLQDIKNLYMNTKDYPSTSQLTSDYFLRDFYKKECAQRLRPNACYADSSIESQWRRLKNVVTDRGCSAAQTLERFIDVYHEDITRASEKSDAVSEIETRVALEYAKKKYSADYAVYRAANAARESLIACTKIETSDCKTKTAGWISAVNRPGVNSFLEKLQSLTVGSQWRSYPIVGAVEITAKDEAYKRKVGLAYRDFVHKLKGKKIDVNYDDYVNYKDSLGDDLIHAQREQHEFVDAFRKDNQTEMLAALDRPGAEAIKKRYLEIRACETSPINQATTESLKK